MLTAPRPSSHSTVMTDKRDDVNWSDKASIWARIPSAKSAVSRACTAIDKLTEREFIYSMPTACEEARKRLAEAFDFCVELHDRWTDLENDSGGTTASETANKSLGPYEDKQFAALAKLDKFVCDNTPSSPVASTSSDMTSSSASTLDSAIDPSVCIGPLDQHPRNLCTPDSTINPSSRHRPSRPAPVSQNLFKIFILTMFCLEILTSPQTQQHPTQHLRKTR